MIDKKELKKKYLLTPKPAGIFKIENKTNGKVFIKSSASLDKVFNRHSFQLKQKVHPSKELQSDWNILGEKSFSFEVIKEIKIKEDPLFNLKEEMEKELELIMAAVPADKLYR